MRMSLNIENEKYWVFFFEILDQHDSDPKEKIRDFSPHDSSKTALFSIEMLMEEIEVEITEKRASIEINHW